MPKIKFLDLFFPPLCMVCNKVCRENKYFSLCKVCNDKINEYIISHDSVVPDFLESADDFYCVYDYKDEVREMFLKFKFHGEIWRGKHFGRLLFNYLCNNNGLDEVDVITYVPTNNKNIAKRGYDQTYEIVSQISRLSKILLVDCLKKDDKIRDNAAEKKSRIDRLKEKKYCIKENSFLLTGKNVLLIDDVLTTGATINECCSLIKGIGAKKVTVAVLATGRKDL